MQSWASGPVLTMPFRLGGRGWGPLESRGSWGCFLGVSPEVWVQAAVTTVLVALAAGQEPASMVGSGQPPGQPCRLLPGRRECGWGQGLSTCSLLLSLVGEPRSKGQREGSCVCWPLTPAEVNALGPLRDVCRGACTAPHILISGRQPEGEDCLCLSLLQTHGHQRQKWPVLPQP